MSSFQFSSPKLGSCPWPLSLTLLICKQNLLDLPFKTYSEADHFLPLPLVYLGLTTIVSCMNWDNSFLRDFPFNPCPHFLLISASSRSEAVEMYIRPCHSFARNPLGALHLTLKRGKHLTVACWALYDEALVVWGLCFVSLILSLSHGLLPLSQSYQECSFLGIDSLSVFPQCSLPRHHFRSLFLQIFSQCHLTVAFLGSST